MSNHGLDPLKVFAAAFAISSVGGLAALLRSKHSLSLRSICSAMLYSGITGLVIALLWYSYFDGNQNLYFLLGVSGLAGIGGTTVLDFCVQVLKNRGIHIIVNPRDEATDDE